MDNLIKRNTPLIAECFDTRIIPKHGENGIYEIEAQSGKILLSGDCKISLAMAYYRYLKEFCNVNLSWCANTNIDIKAAPLPDKKITHVFEQKKRAYMNYCTFGYSACWWNWERWEREIDFMAMNGINMPLSIVGTEAVWFYALLDMGFEQNDALDFLSGPMYWPWQLMTNIDSYMPLVDHLYIKKRMELGKKIIERELELGMTPIQQGFSGHVPRIIKGLAKKAKITVAKPWCNFHPTFQLDPLDPLFSQIGRALLEKQKELFGAYHYYACDPFHENEPPVKGDDYLANVGRAISQLYSDFDNDAVWVMQSWSLREQIVKAVPKKRLLILDIDSNKYEETDGFWGYDFILGKIHNFGGRTVLHGSIKALADNPYLEVKKKYPNLIGTGLFMEGINQNPLYYDLAFEMLTASEKKDLDSWLCGYARRRYGSDEDCLKDAVHLLGESCYSESCTGRETGSIICARPSTEIRHTAPNDFFELRYDNKKLFESVRLMLESQKAKKEGYLYDLCDILRQALSNLAKEYYIKAMEGFNKKNAAVFENGCNSFLEVCEDVDRLVSTIPEMTLGYYLKEARECALLDADKQNFEMNLLMQITLWGPAADTQLYDYAWKEWGDLIKTYYIKRWRAFFEYLASEFARKKAVSTVTKIRYCDRDDYLGNAPYKKMAKFERNWLSGYRPCKESEEKTIAVAGELYKKYSEKIK